ncbi:MAG TPA: hypothetical protein VLJ11_10730 [Bryobacteraceae bacterium]|nr:hypothetical protein [Bryobacteraceae bacterium]
MRRLRSGTRQESEVERREHQEDSNVHHQPRPEPIPEKQHVNGDYDGYQPEHVKHDGCLSSHASFYYTRAAPGSGELRTQATALWHDMPFAGEEHVVR